MRIVRRRALDVAAWEESLLAMDTEVLLSLARNYIGAVKSPWDKRVVVDRLVAFAKKPETIEAMLALLDRMDAAIACTIILAGPLTDGELRSLFRGEVRAFDLGVKIANLEDRLVLFRLREGRAIRFAVNPLLEEFLAPLAHDPRVALGGVIVPPGSANTEIASAEGLSPLAAALGFFSFLFHSPGAVKRDGALSKKAALRLSVCIPESIILPERYTALLKAFEETGILAKNDGEGDFDADAATFKVLFDRHGLGLPFRLALALSLPRGGHASAAEELATLVGRALESLPRGLAIPEAGLSRWVGIATIGFDPAFDTDALVDALSKLGMLVRRAGAFVLAPGSERGEAEGTKEARPQLVADGAHLLRVLPEAGAEARWLAARIARPARLGLVWELELDRDSVREAFASGLDAREIVADLATFSVRPLPQSLAFSIESWEKEFLSTRLFHGWVLVCDERRRPIVEGRPDISALVKERLGPGVYLLDAGELEDFAPTLAAAGIEVPPPIRPHAHPQAGLSCLAASSRRSDTPDTFDGETGAHGASDEISALRAEAASDATGPAAVSNATGPATAALNFDPSPRIAALKAALASRAAVAKPDHFADGPSVGATPAERAAHERSVDRERDRATARSSDREKELADRIETRLILDEAQLDRADVTPVRVEAAGLDYGGKTRLAERAIASPGDRLEINYQLPGGDPETVVVRPVRLQKTDRGLVLEGEDLAAGTPVRVPLGAASMVRRLRATPFGDER